MSAIVGGAEAEARPAAVPTLPIRAGTARVERGVLVAVVLIALMLVAYPMLFLFQVSLNVGRPDARPIVDYGVANYAKIFDRLEWLGNTLYIAVVGTAAAVLFGLILAWIINRTNVPGARVFEQLIIMPFYITPLVGALAWSALASPRSGFVNKLWQSLTGVDWPLVNVNTPGGIIWVMALYEGTVAFMIISAAMKSMDPSLEESSQVLGAGKFSTAFRITAPLLKPAILGAAAFVFAEMVGSFAVVAILGAPVRFHVVTTGIYLMLTGSQPNYPAAAAMGISLFAFTGLAIWLYGKMLRGRDYATITGKAFRPRKMDMRRWRPVLFGICALYVTLSAILPMIALILASFLKFNTTVISDMSWTADNYQTVFSKGATVSALQNSMIVSFGTASIGVVFMGIIAWFIYRSRASGRGMLEYVVMFPQAVPRMVFSLGLLWAWIVMPIGIYGTLWLLLLAYLTIFLPLGVRSISGVMLQLERSVEECARVCGASWATTMRTITLPLMRPGILAAWVLLFIVSLREVGASVLLISARTKVIGPSIIESWEATGTQLTAAMAIVQSLVVLGALLIVQRLVRSQTET
ncbi:MAG: iron ABC transporter permease [Chloroflexota bacterium]